MLQTSCHVPVVLEARLGNLNAEGMALAHYLTITPLLRQRQSFESTCLIALAVETNC